MSYDWKSYGQNEFLITVRNETVIYIKTMQKINWQREVIKVQLLVKFGSLGGKAGVLEHR